MRHASSADRVAEFARVAWTPRHQIHLATGNNRWLGPPLALALVAAAALSPKVGFVQWRCQRALLMLRSRHLATCPEAVAVLATAYNDLLRHCLSHVGVVGLLVAMVGLHLLASRVGPLAAPPWARRRRAWTSRPAKFDVRNSSGATPSCMKGRHSCAHLADSPCYPSAAVAHGRVSPSCGSHFIHAKIQKATVDRRLSRGSASLRRASRSSAGPHAAHARARHHSSSHGLG